VTVHTPAFEITVSIEDERFIGAVGAVVLQAAATAGCPSDEAARFAKIVEDAIIVSLDEPREHALLAVVVRRRSGPVEVLANGRTLSLDVRHG
jgi:hypothetical protein